MKRMPILMTPERKDALKEALETLRPHMHRRGQLTDFVNPAIDKFIEAANKGKSLEFIEYIKSFK